VTGGGRPPGHTADVLASPRDEQRKGSLEPEREAREALLSSLEALHASAFCWALHCCNGDRSEAEDVLHDVYVKILEGRARFGGRSSPKTWLFAVVRTTAGETRRRLARRLRLLQAAPPAVAPAAPSPWEELSEREERERLLSVLLRLPARQREVARLVFYHDLTLEDASAVMGVSPGSARVHYDRAKRRLREALAPKETAHA
jgi:RNA polymerase sigma factor (sigma-70 family)